MTTARVTEQGVLLPLDVVGLLGVRVGDDLQVIATDKSVSVKKCEPDVESPIEVARRVMEKRSDVLRRLAE